MTRRFLNPSLRPLIRRPGLALARLATVVMVVFATAAVTAIASATLLRPLPFPDPDRLVSIYSLSTDTTDVTQATPLFPLEFEHLDARGGAHERGRHPHRARRSSIIRVVAAREREHAGGCRRCRGRWDAVAGR